MGLIKRWRLENIMLEKDKQGTYVYYNERKVPIYAGHASQVRQRLLAAWYGRSDYAEVRGKKTLRALIRFYKVDYRRIEFARKLEGKRKWLHRLRIRGYNKL